MNELGAQDPELKNSPIAWELDEEIETLRGAVAGDALCYYNGHSYDHGTTVRGGEAVLRCDRGVWVPERDDR